jgi:hypothetical protein
MEDLYLNFGGREYYIDFDELDKFLFVKLDDKKVEETEERMIFDKDGNLTGAEKTSKSFTNEKEINGVRYEVITNMLETILYSNSGEDGDDLLGAKRVLDDASLAYKLAFNTLIKYKILKEIKE